MHNLPNEYVIVEIIPSSSKKEMGLIIQIQALKVNNNKIVSRFDYRLNDSLIPNNELRKMISYDKEMFNYTDDSHVLMNEFLRYIGNLPLFILFNSYTLDYLSEIRNVKKDILSYLKMEDSIDIFDKIIKKYQLQPSNHLVDLLYEALIYENE